MKNEEKARRTSLKINIVRPLRQWFKIQIPNAALLMLMLAVSILPAEALPTRQNVQATSELTFTAETSTQVQEVTPDTPTLTELPPATFTSTQAPTATPPPTASQTAEPTLTETPTDTPADQPGATDTELPVLTITNPPTDTAPATSTSPDTPSTTATVYSTITLTFTATADARVSERYPTKNYGSGPLLRSNGISGKRQNSYIRFTFSGISGPIQRVTLRVFCTTNGTRNGPGVHLTKNDWIESGPGRIDWINQPALWSGAADNKTRIETNSWVEYDVTPLVTGNGTYTFALIADSTDGVIFSSREGTTPPQLVVTFTSAPAITPTQIPTLTEVGSPSPGPDETASVTPLPSGSVIVVGAGDIATCWRNQDELTAQLLDSIPGTVFTAGDNAYVDGSSTEYINCYDPTWGRHKSRTKPSPGNHEYHTSGATGYFQYFYDIPAHYAYDLGSWRIYALNSEISVSATSAQVSWLRDDLAANPRQCVLAYWHKPRWSSGSHHGNNSAMQTLWQTLYDAGAELVINGHEHHYERFAPMNASGTAVSQGLREIIVGTGGAGLYPFGSPLPASEVRNNTTYGVLKLTLHPDRYDWEFVPVAGSTFTDSGRTACR